MTERFSLGERLGRGAMGEVYRATDAETGATVALKLLHPFYADEPAYRERFAREVELARRIDSPNVVKVLGYGIREGRPYVALEYVEGRSLLELIAGHGPYGWPEARLLLAQITAGLAAAHGAGVLHRDVKPSNVLVTPDGVAKLTDFGIAKGFDLTRLTGTSTILGTPTYLAPEGPLDERSDLYGLGVVAYELLAGVPPFEGDSHQAVILAHVRTPPDLSRLPPESRALVGALLAKDPRARPQSAGAVLAVLTPPVPRPAPGRPTVRLGARPQARAALGSIAALAALAVVVVLVAANSGLGAGASASPSPGVEAGAGPSSTTVYSDRTSSPPGPPTSGPPTDPPSAEPVAPRPPTDPPSAEPVAPRPPTDPPSAGPVAPRPPTDPPSAERVPAAPTNLSAAGVSTTSIRISWSDVSFNETSFVIQRWTGSAFLDVGSVGANAKSWTDTGLAPGKEYAYKVCSVNGAGFTCNSNGWVSGTTQALPPTETPTTTLTPPSGFRTGGTSGNGIEIRWDNNSACPPTECPFSIDVQVINNAGEVWIGDGKNPVYGTSYLADYSASVGTGWLANAKGACVKGMQEMLDGKVVLKTSSWSPFTFISFHGQGFSCASVAPVIGE